MKYDWLFPIAGYLCGSIPFAYIITKIVKGTDIRKQGSGNVGATNSLRVLGVKWALLVMILDMLKLLPILLLARSMSISYNTILITAVAGVLGHNWPILLGFKGGKGVAVSATIFFFLFPLPGLIVLGIFILAIALSRFVSLGSILAAISAPMVIYLYGSSTQEVIFVALLACLLIFMHRANLQRLIAGKESKIVFKRS